MFPAAAVASITAPLPHGTCSVYDDTEEDRTWNGANCSEQEVPDAVAHGEKFRGDRSERVW